MAIVMKPIVNATAARQIVRYHETRCTDVLQIHKVPLLPGKGGLPPGVEVLLISREDITAD